MFAQTLAWGMIMTYGTILAFYTRYLIPDVSAPLVTLAGALQPFLCLLLAIIWGRLLDAGHHRKLLTAAGVSLVGGFVGLSFTGTNEYRSGQYWAIVLASVPTGIGMSIYWMSAPQVAKSWLPQRKGLAMGVTNSGAAVGGVAWPLVFDAMVDIRGFREGCLVLSGIIFVMSCFVAAFLTPGPRFRRRQIGQPTKLRAWLPTRSFRSKVFLCHVIAMNFVYAGILTIPYFIEFWARANGDIGVTEDIRSGPGIDVVDSNKKFTVYLLVGLNAAQFPGRVFGSLLCDKWSARKIHAISCVLGVIVIGSFWFSTTSFAVGMSFAMLYGLVAGLLASLPVNDVQEILTHRRTNLFGQYCGAVYLCAAVPVLVGLLIAGALVERFTVFTSPAVWAMSCFSASAFFICLGLWIEDDTHVFDEDYSSQPQNVQYEDVVQAVNDVEKR